MGSRAEREEVLDLVTLLEPVVMKRIGRAQRRTPETLPVELIQLERVIVLRNLLGGPKRRLLFSPPTLSAPVCLVTPQG